MPRIFEQVVNNNPSTSQRIGFGRAANITENMTLANFLLWLGINLNLAPGAWQSPSYNINFSAGTVPFQYRLTAQGDLQFRGDVVSTVASGVAFTLAVNYRPANHIKGAFANASGVFVYSMSLSNPGELFVVGSWAIGTDNSFNDIIPLT